MITKKEFQNKFLEIFKGADLSKVEEVQPKFMEFYSYIAKNYSNLDSETKSAADSMTDALEKQFQKAVADMPGSEEKRLLERKLAQMGGKHQSAEQLITILGNKPHYDVPILKASEVLFTDELQSLLDLLYDVTRRSHKGPAGFARLTVAHSTINELLVAHHLAQRAFINQFYTHIRAVLENRDKIDLFTLHPEWAVKWVQNGEDRDVQHELRPAGIREKLGRTKRDPIYSAMSSLGTHTTFEGIRLISAKTIDHSEDVDIAFKVWVGGCPRLDQVVFMHSLMHLVLIKFFCCLTSSFEKELSNEEYFKVIKNMCARFQIFFSEHYMPWAQENNFDTTSLSAIVDQLKPDNFTKFFDNR
jgi:hypothetical protein